MRFAVKTRPEHQTWEEIRDAWIAADEIPLFESAWNWDHFYPLTGDLTGPNFEAWTMLAAMAQATRRIRLGCQVTGMVYRHPAVLANMAATVDIIRRSPSAAAAGSGRCARRRAGRSSGTPSRRAPRTGWSSRRYWPGTAQPSGGT